MSFPGTPLNNTGSTTSCRAPLAGRTSTMTNRYPTMARCAVRTSPSYAPNPTSTSSTCACTNHPTHGIPLSAAGTNACTPHSSHVAHGIISSPPGIYASTTSTSHTTCSTQTLLWPSLSPRWMSTDYELFSGLHTATSNQLPTHSVASLPTVICRATGHFL